MVLIGDVSYTTIKEAINAGNIECTLKLEGAMTEDVLIPANRVVNIDLNGNILGNVAGDLLTVKGRVRVYDSAEHDGGKLNNTVAGKSVVKVLKDGMADIDVLVESTQTDAPMLLNVGGNLTLSKDTVITSSNTDRAVIENGNKKGDFATTTILGGTFNVVGGTFVLNHETGVVNIFGGNLESSTNGVKNQGILNVKDGILTASEKVVVTISDDDGFGTTSILDGEIAGGEPNDIGVSESGKGVGKAVVKVRGGNFAHTVPPEYLAPGAVVVAGVGEELGTFNVVFPMDAIKGDLGMVGGGFVAKARMVLHYDTLTYKTGGITLPVLPMAVDAVVVNVKDGAMAYFDRTEKKVVLYSANKTEIVGETVLEDLNLIIIGQ